MNGAAYHGGVGPDMAGDTEIMKTLKKVGIAMILQIKHTT